MTRWYLVKVNWEATAEAFPLYAGLGGDVWPLDQVETRVARDLHTRLMNEREYVVLGEFHEAVCTSLELAVEYAAAVGTVYGSDARVWTLEIGTAANGECDGFDIGSPGGGFSLIETEIIHGGKAVDLNRHGLFRSVEEAESFLRSRNRASQEDADGYQVLQVKVL